ncbi:MAG: formate/nitrite transporter family protein [Rhodobacterales bacterium]|nr:formate/nitrite transporter family protein [Rhodobacterales bacterium]MDX5413114.1 formate/nitrite transporter family protein [Rhodobacterales bacterium]
MSSSPDSHPQKPSFSDHRKHKAEEDSVNDATRLSARLIYEVIRRDGDIELTRPLISLFWSGIAAGLLMSLSVLGEATLRTHLPKADWVFLVENAGYSLGFLVVILGRMQLFTENTITTVLPVVADRSLRKLTQMIRLWAIVLLSNVAGACLAAVYMVEGGAFTSDMLQTMSALSNHAVLMGAQESFTRAIPAGVLVAAIVWMLPSAGAGRFFIILTFTWLIAAGDFTHIIAGAVEMWLLVWTGDIELWRATRDFFLPVLAGNVIGGTAIFTLLAWGQVKNEVPH